MRNGQCDTVTIATKINRNSKILLEAIAEQRGLKIYNLLQVIINAYLRYFSTGQHVTDETKQIVNAFTNFHVAKDAFFMCAADNPQKPKNIKACIAFVEQKDKGITQPTLIYTKKDVKGNTITFECMADDAILKTYLQSIAPDAIDELREIKDENGLLSLTDALKFAIHKQAYPTQYNITADIEELFADNSRADNGNVICFEDCASQYVQHRNKKLAYMK